MFSNGGCVKPSLNPQCVVYPDKMQCITSYLKLKVMNILSMF